MGGVILVAVLFLWWLLRAETRDEAEQRAAGEAEQGPTGPGPPAV